MVKQVNSLIVRLQELMKKKQLHFELWDVYKSFGVTKLNVIVYYEVFPLTVHMFRAQFPTGGDDIWNSLGTLGSEVYRQI